MVERQLAAAKEVEGFGGRRRGAGRDFERRQRGSVASRLDERHAEAQISRRIRGRQRELLPKFGNGCVEANDAFFHHRKRTEVVMRAADPRIHLQRGFERDASSFVLAGVAVCPPDQHVCLRQGACLHHVGKQTCGDVRLAKNGRCVARRVRAADVLRRLLH